MSRKYLSSPGLQDKLQDHSTSAGCTHLAAAAGQAGLPDRPLTQPATAGLDLFRNWTPATPREQKRSSPFNLSLDEARNNQFRFLPREGGLSPFQLDEYDPANTSKESGFCSSSSEAPSHYGKKQQLDTVLEGNASLPEPVYGATESVYGAHRSLVASPLSPRVGTAGTKSSSASAGAGAVAAAPEPAYSRLQRTRSQNSLQSYSGSVESPRPGGVGGGIYAGGPGNRHLINHLSDEFSVKSDESSACNSEPEPRKLRQTAIAEKLGKSRGGSSSDKSAKSEPDGKISKRKTSSDYFERKSLYKPLQKIYSFKSKFTDRKSGGKAQEKLSEKALAPAVLLAAAAEVKSPQVVARKSALVKSSSSSEVAIKGIIVDGFSDKDSDQTSDISTLNSRTLPKTKGVRFLQTFLKPLYFEVPVSFPVAQFTGRDWLYQEVADQLTADRGRGVLIIGGPGSGKTASILSLVERSCFGHRAAPPTPQTGIVRSRSAGSISLHHQLQQQEQEEALPSLARSVVAYHFCQADNAITCRVPEFIHSVAAQISQSPQLSAYFHLIQNEDSVRKMLSVSHCMANPTQSLVVGVLEPLKQLKKLGKISGETCIIVVDGLCEAEQYRPDFGDSIGTFLAKHLLKFPVWLKVVCTVRSQYIEITRLLSCHTFKISLDGVAVEDERLRQDMKVFIGNRIQKSKLIRGNMKSKAAETESLEKFSEFLVTRAKGCFLYTKLVLDLIERGQLVLKSGSYQVIPRNLSEIFMLIFNLRFSTALSYERVSDIFAVCLASLQSLTLAEVFRVYSSLSLHPQVSWREFRTRYNSIADLLVTRSDGSMMFFHPTLRDWLNKRREGESERFLVEGRSGHSAIAFSMARASSRLRPEKLLTLVHHLLKANLNKNSDALESVSAKDIQAAFVSLTSEDVSAALGCTRNIYAPVIKVSRLLLLAGASPDHTTEELEQAPILGLYSALGTRDMVHLLLEFSADVDKANNRGETPLYFASREGHIEIVDYLIHCRAQLNRVTDEGVCALVAAARHGHDKVVELLLLVNWDEDPVHLLEKEEAANQALVAAAHAGHKQVVEYLLDVPSVTPDYVDTLTGMTGLAATAASGHKTIAQLLIQRGARLDGKCLDGQTALHQASRHGCWDMVDMLLKGDAGMLKGDAAGMLVEIKDAKGRTPLTMAAIGGHLGVVELLVDRGGCGEGPAGLYGVDEEGLGPLHHAVLQGHQHVVRLLLDKGAAVNKPDLKGRSCLSLSVEGTDLEITEILLDFQANMEIGDHEGRRPLEKAIRLDKAETVSCFLRRGAKLGSGTWIIADGKPDIQMILINKILEDGNTLFRKNKLQEAAHRYKYALRRIPRMEVEWEETFCRLENHLLLNLSRCERRMGNFKEAEKLAQQVLEFEPGCVEALVARAKACKAAGRKAEAVAILAAALDLVPANREISKALAKLREELDERGPLVQISPFLGSVQSIPYIDDSSTNCSSSIHSS